jgi:hypothetical protein
MIHPTTIPIVVAAMLPWSSETGVWLVTDAGVRVGVTMACCPVGVAVAQFVDDPNWMIVV